MRGLRLEFDLEEMREDLGGRGVEGSWGACDFLINSYSCATADDTNICPPCVKPF